MTDELVPQPEPFVITPELQAAIDLALAELRRRPYAGRHPSLGKMINCGICRSRHRKNARLCEQKFTYTGKDEDGFVFEYLRVDEEGNTVPDYRTAAKEGERPTMKQVMGAAAFAKKRFHPHHSKVKLLFIQRTREVFDALDFSLDTGKDSQGKVIDKDKNDAFEKNLQRARVVAARQIRKERRFRTRKTNRQADKARRINKGLL